MVWQSVAEGYDAPKGERIRIIYQVNVPEWLEWTPDYIMDYLMRNMGNLWAEIQRAVIDFDVERYEVKTVKAGNIYHIIIYGTSRGVAVWLGATIILTLILAIIIGLTLLVRDVQKWIPAGVIRIGALALLLFAVYLLAPKKKNHTCTEHQHLY